MRRKKPRRKEAQNDREQRHANFALQAADRIRSMEQCLFSLLPQDDLKRQAADWYNACAEGMLRGNYALIDLWVRDQAARAAQEGFALEDLLELLRACRKCAIEVDRWNEDVLSPVDAVINEALSALREKIAWLIPAEINYLARNDDKPELAFSDRRVVSSDNRSADRRNVGRCQLWLPIRVRNKNASQQEQEITKTLNVSRTGLRFITTKTYAPGLELMIVFPYWASQDAFNREYAARVIRADSLPNGTQDVAVQFLDALGRKVVQSAPSRVPENVIGHSGEES